jgi:predicted nucleic acid-binding protein
MPLLTDTNVLLRFVNPNDVGHRLVRQAVATLLARGEALHYTQQNRREFWNACTRPADRNGLGFTIAQTLELLAEVDAIFMRLPEHPHSGAIWDRLVTQYAVVGVAVHDAQLVASMLAHDIPAILTLNNADFARYREEINVVHPADLAPAADAQPQE